MVDAYVDAYARQVFYHLSYDPKTNDQYSKSGRDEDFFHYHLVIDAVLERPPLGKVEDQNVNGTETHVLGKDDLLNSFKNS